MNTIFYGIMGEGKNKGNVPILITREKDEAVKNLDRNYPILVELTVTKTYIRENEIKEYGKSI